MCIYVQKSFCSYGVIFMFYFILYFHVLFGLYLYFYYEKVYKIWPISNWLIMTYFDLLRCLEGYSSTCVLIKPETGNTFSEIWQGVRFPFSINFFRLRQPVTKIIKHSIKHNLLGFSLKKRKDSSIKTALPLSYINVVGQ